MKHRFAYPLAALLMAGSAVPASASLATPQLVASAACPDCIDYRVVGVCYWLLCTPFGCSVKTSVKVRHFIPQVVVSAYRQPGDNPWREVAMLSRSALGGLADGGGENQQKRGQRKDNVRYRSVDAIGHPAASLIGQQTSGYSCKGAATAWQPYFLSNLDALMWRTGLPESVYPEALTPGRREIGATTAGNMWGNVYPRSGFVTQTDDYKAAAVTAQRAADIITRPGQIHVYRTLKANASAGYWPPDPVTENTGTRNHKWQRLAPKVSMSCAAFPDRAFSYAEDGNYAWALWQPFACCKKRGQTFLFSTDIGGY
ncbi:TIGR03756 family integrating conjugative element protein [Klebsiella pneumoniae]|nr:TIGR03756 family integrating conjugative element protein [Klebsiella pneumoniae]